VSRVPGYGIANISATWNLKPLTLTAFVNNFVDRLYATDRRSIFGDFAQLGPPRTVGLSAPVDF
jgi:outer membrane receptor protein involved in Fe transport